MEKRGIFRLNNKKSESLIYPIVIFITLNIIFFSILLFFVFKSSTAAGIYEQAYAKQIALMIDEAKSSMSIFINLEKEIKIAEKNKQPREEIISTENNEVIVKLSNKGGYSYRYFSDYDVSSYFDENKLVININEKK
tara:strand:- start:670 stop:1080 length:411 start_codon:yes stop_codon:yes gene_type:complete